MSDKTKQVIALFGGFLGALLLFFNSVGVTVGWFNEDSINAFIGVVSSLVAFLLAAYGVYKNSYLLSKKAKLQEDVLKKRGLK